VHLLHVSGLSVVKEALCFSFKVRFKKAESQKRIVMLGISDRNVAKRKKT